MEHINRWLSQTTIEVLIPALILMSIAVLLVIVLFMAQRREDFDVAQFLQDENGKYSALRAWGFICLGIHSWWVATLVFKDLATENHFLYYGIIWAGTPVMMEFAKRWTGALPLTGNPPIVHTHPKPPEPPQGAQQ